MFNTCRETTGCYGDVNVEPYPQNVDGSEKVSSNSGPAWNMHASGATVHGAHHSNHPAHSSHSPAPAAPAAPAHFHSAFHHHAANPAVDSYGYSLAQAPHKENDPLAGKDVIRSSPPPAAVPTATWQNNRSRSRYPPAMAAGAFLPYPTQLNHYDGPPLEAGPHGMGHGHMLSRKQSWPGENPFPTMPAGAQYQRDPSSAMYGENMRGNVTGGIIRHTTNVSGIEARNSPSQQHQAVPQHLHHQQQSLLHQQQQQQQQHSAPHHQLLCQLVQKEREAHRLPGYQDRHSVVRSRISAYHEPLFPQHQHLQYCSSQDVLRKVPLPVPMDGDRRSAFTSARQTSAYTHGPTQWTKSAVPFMPPFHTQQVLAPHRGGASAFQPCNKVGEHEAYPPESLIWSKSGQAGPDYGGHMQGPGQAGWMHDAQSQMFHSRQMSKQSIINNGSNVLGLDAVQMGGHAAMHASGGRQAGVIPKGAPVAMAYQQQHLHMHNPHVRSQMMHQPQAPPQHALQQQPMMQQHQSSPLSNSQHSPMVTSPHDMQSPQMTNPCSQQPSHPQALQQNDSQLMCDEGDGKESRGNSRSLRNCLDVRQFIENWDEDTEVGTPRPCIDEAEAGDNAEQPLDSTQEALIVLDCRSLRREEAANLLNMYSVPEAEGLLACSGDGMFSAATDTVAQSALQNLLDSVTSSGSSSTTIATPMASPTGQTGGRSLDMLLNAALPTPPASQEHNIAQTNMALSTPVAVVNLNSPMSPHLGETIRQPKMDETGFGVLSPTSPAASVKFTCATVHTPFVKFSTTDDPPSVIQSSRDHMGFSAAHQFSSDKKAVNLTSPSASRVVDQLPVPVPLLPVDVQPPTAETDNILSPAPSDASTESKMTASLRAFRKQKAHSPDHMSEAHSFDSNSHDTSDVHPRSSRTSSLMESDDAVDRSQWAFAQITKTSSTPSREDFRANNASSIIKMNHSWEMTDNVQDLQNFKSKPYSSSVYAMVDKSTAPLNCSLETQKSDSSKFDKSTSPTIFLTSKDTQTEETRQDRRRIDTCAFNDTFAQTSVRCIQDEIQNDTFAQTPIRSQDEIHHESFAQTSLLSLHEEIEDYTAEEPSCHTPHEKLPLNPTDLLRVESLSKQTEIDTEFSSGPTHSQRMDIANEAKELPTLNEAVAEATNINKSNAVCGTSDLVATDFAKSQDFSKVLENEAHFRGNECRTESSSTSVANHFSPSQPDLNDCVKVSSPACTKLNKQLEDLETNEDVPDKTCGSSCSNVKMGKLASSSDRAISTKGSDSDERNRSIGTGTDEELINNEFCPQYLSRIVDSSPGNIPKILLSRLREKSSKKNGVIKRLPSIRLTRVCSPMSSSLSDPEYVCSVSDTEPGTPSRYDTNTLDSVLSDQASNDHKRSTTLHRRNKRVKHCDAEVQSSIDVRPSEDSEALSVQDSSIDKCNPSTDVPSENDIASTADDSLHISTSDNRNDCPKMAAKSPREGRSIEVQTEGQTPSGEGMTSSDDTVLNIPQSDSLNGIKRNTGNESPRFSASSSHGFILTEHQETGLTKELRGGECSSYNPNLLTLEKTSKTSVESESQGVLPFMTEEEPTTVLNEELRTQASNRECLSTKRSSPSIGLSTADLETESIPDFASGPHETNNSKAIDQWEKGNTLLVPEENELAIDLSLQKIENRRSGVEDVSDLNTLASSQSNSLDVRPCEPELDFPVPGGMTITARWQDNEEVVFQKSCDGSSPETISPITVEYHKVDEIVSEKDKIIDRVMTCDEKVKQAKEFMNVNPSHIVEFYKVDGNVNEKDEWIDKMMSCEEKVKQSEDLVSVNPSSIVEYYKVDGIAFEKDKLLMSCDENVEQHRELLNVNQEDTKTSTNLPDLSKEAVSHCSKMGNFKAVENVSPSDKTALHSSVESVIEENVFLSPRSLSKHSSVNICENDIGHSTVNLKASSQEFFETNNSFVETCSPLAEKNIMQENIVENDPNVKDEVVLAGNSAMSPVVEVASSHRIVLSPSSERRDPTSISAGTSETPEHLPATQSTELSPEENLTNCVPFSEPVEYSDLFGVNSNDTKCDLSDVVVTTPSSREESPQSTPESCHGMNIQKGSETTSVLSTEILENSNVHSSSVSPDPHSQMQSIVNRENLPQPGSEENCSSASPSCNSKPHETPIDCGEQHFSTGLNADDPSPKSHGYSNADLDKKDESLLEFDTQDLQKNVEDDAQPAPVSVTSYSTGSLVQQVDESGGSASGNSVHASDADRLCKDHTQEKLVGDLENPTEDATANISAPPEVMVDLLIPDEVASSEEGTSLMSVSEVIQMSPTPSIEHDSAKCVDTRVELPSNQENQVNPEILLENTYNICLSDIPLPSEEGYQNYLAKRNLVSKPEPVNSQSVGSSENSHSRNFCVQVEEDSKITTADKDTQSSDDSFSLSDEEKAFPDPCAPNFDVARIPLPDECIAIKNRILKARNRKRPRELCGNECCSSAESSKFSEANSTGTSVGIQCSKSRDSRNFFSLRSKSSQTHKIQIKLKPRRPSLGSIHSHNTQTLMEVVEEVSKVLHDVDSADCVQQIKEKGGLASISYPEDRPQACEYVIEPNRSKYCDYAGVEADRIDDCNFLEVRCKEVFPVKDCNILEGRIEEKTVTSSAVLKQGDACPEQMLEESVEPSQDCNGEGLQDPADVTPSPQGGAQPSLDVPLALKNSAGHSLDPQGITKETIASRCDDAVANNVQDSPDILTLSDLPPSNVPDNVSCSEALHEIQMSCSTPCVELERKRNVSESQESTKQCFVPNEIIHHLSNESLNPSTSSFSKESEKNCKSPILNLNIKEICKPDDKICSEASSFSTTAENNGEISRFEKKTEVLNCPSMEHELLLDSLDLDLSGTEVKCLDLIAEDCHEKWEDFSTVDNSALSSSTDRTSKSFDSGRENGNKRNESEVHRCTSKPVVSDTDIEKTETFENKFENGSNSSFIVETQKFIEEEQKIICDKHERENVPSAREEEYINADVGVADQFVDCGNEKEETASMREIENSFLTMDGPKILPKGEEDEISDADTGKENSFPFSHKNIPSDLDEKVPFLSTELSSLNPPCMAIDCASSDASEANISFDEVHMAIGKRVYKLSAEWQTVYLGEDDNEEDDTETFSSSCQNLAINPEEHVKTLPASTEDVFGKSQESPSNSNAHFVEFSDMEPPIVKSILELVDDDEDDEVELNEDDLPPLDAPGLEVANAADSDSDREMPCLEPQSDDQVLSNTSLTPSGETHLPSSTSESVQERISPDLSTTTYVPNVSKNSEEVDEGHVTPPPNASAEGNTTSRKASPAVPVFSTLRLSSGTAPRKDMPRLGTKRPHDSDHDSDESAGSETDDDNCASGSDADAPRGRSGRRKRPRGKRLLGEDANDAEPSRAAEDCQLGDEVIGDSDQLQLKEAEAEALLEEGSEAVEDTAGLSETAEDLVSETLEEELQAVEENLEAVELSETLEEELEAVEEVSEALEEELEAVEEVSEAVEVVTEEPSNTVKQLGAVCEAVEVVEQVPEEAVLEVPGPVSGVGVDCIEISDIRTDPTEWIRDADMAVAEDSTWRCVEVISTEESVREEVVETVDETAVEAEVEADEVGEPRPRLRCSLSWDRVLLAGEAFVLEPAKVGVRLDHGADEAGAGEAGAASWNVVDKDAEAVVSAHEENNNHLPKSPPSSSMFKVTKLILERPAPPASPSHSTACTSHSDSRSPDGGHCLKTKGALKSYLTDSGSVTSQGSRRRGESRQEKNRHRHGKRRWYSHLSSAASTPARSSRSPGADGEVPKVIIKRQSSPASPARQLQHGRIRIAKSPVVVLERDPRIDAMALRAAARLRRLKLGKELRASEPGRSDGSTGSSAVHAPSRGSSQRGSSEPRGRRQSPPPRKRSRSVREHGVRHGVLAEAAADDEAGKAKRRKKSSSSSGHDEERRERGRRRSRDKDRKAVAKAAAAAHMHINELVKRWQMTPPGKDTPMPMPSPDRASALGLTPPRSSPQYAWHQVEAEVPVFADAVAAEPEAEAGVEPGRGGRGHWSQLLDAPFMAVSGDATLPAQAEAEAQAGDVYECEACGKALSGEPSPARADHIKQHPYHCQRCYQAFASQSDFTQHLKVAHPNTQELHHCLLCLRTFPTEKQHAIHMKGQSHCHMERSQRRTIHTLFRMFTGSDCPRLSPLTPEDMHALDWLPNDSGVIHFYHQATPLQIATEDWHLHHGIASIKSVKKDTQNPD